MEIEKLLDEYVEVERDHPTLTQLHEMKRAALLSAFNKLREERDRLDSACATFKSESDRFDQVAFTYEADIEELRSENERLKADLTDAVNTTMVQNLNQKILKLERENAELRAKLELKLSVD